MNTQRFKAKATRRLAACISALLIMTGGMMTAYAGVQNNGKFELGDDSVTPSQGSADILGSSTQPGPDWADIFTDNSGTVTGGLFGGEAAAFTKDDLAQDRTVYSGGPGDKNSFIVTDWTWTTSSVPAKDDISNAYAYAVKDSIGHLIIYVGAERLAPNGDSHIDVEFFQNPVGLDHAIPCPAHTVCHFTGSNKDDDLLVSMDYTNGGAFAGLTIRKRQEGAPDNYVAVATLNAEGCNDPNGDGSFSDATVCGFTNGGSIDGGPWDNFDSHDHLITSLPANAFVEYGVDVTALLGKDNLCFSTFEVKTRSSQSFTATLKDFALHSFESCVATVKTKVIQNSTGGIVADDDGLTSTVAALTVIHDTAIVTGSVGAPTPTGTVTFSLYNNGSCTTPAASSEDGTLAETTPPGAGTPGIATAASGNFTMPPGSTISYKAHYNPAAGSPYPAADSGCEVLTAGRLTSQVITDIKQGTANGADVLNTKVPLNQTLVDLMTVTGTAGFDPTGTVTVHRYTSANCTTEASGYPKTISLAVGSDTTDGISTATDSYTPTAAAGEFVSWLVTYDGDAHYDPTKIGDSHCEPVCAFTAVSQ